MSWYQSLPPGEASVPCGTGTHTVCWEAGRLVLPAHPDAEAELVLAALGGDKARCVEVAETWARHVADLDVLMTGPRSRADKVTVSWDEAEEHRATWFGLPPGLLRAAAAGGPGGPGGPGSGRTARAVSAGPGASPGPGRVRPAPPGLPRHFASRVPEELARRVQARIEVLQLLALGPGLQFRLAGTVAASWAAADRQADRSARRPELVAALTGRVAPAVADWLGVDPDTVTVTPAEPPGPAGSRPWGTLEVSGSGGRQRLRGSLPIGWLSEVWACGLAVVDRHLVVAVETPGWPVARVLALPSPGGEAVALDVVGAAWGPGGLPRWEIARGLRS